MSEAVVNLQNYIGRIVRLGQVASLVGWDQQTYMPEGAASARAEQMAALSETLHEMITAERCAKLLEAAEREIVGMEADSDEVRAVKNIRRQYNQATKLPATLVAELSRQQALGQESWLRARANNDFPTFAPAMERVFELTRQKAECLGYTEHIYDALLDEYEYGVKHSDIVRLFEEMKPKTVALTHAIAQSKKPVDSSLLFGTFPVDRQRELTLKLVRLVGFDLHTGRQDEAPHPFCSNASKFDVRLTTRFDPNYLGQAVYASLHEAGHGMYEQGSPDRFEGTVLAGGTSLGVHESQSRFWENLIGRSRAFCNLIFPEVQATFPDALSGQNAEAFYRAVNKVEPSFIRVEADEVTYNLHVLVRFEIESDLLMGKLAFKDVPEAWNAKMQAYLGITPRNDSEGCLQDVHWSEGLIGYFPTYTLGNLLSCQLLHAMKKEEPNLEAKIEAGDLTFPLQWLRTHVHAHAAKFLPSEVAVKATGEPLTSTYYVDYLNKKFGEIYGV